RVVARDLLRPQLRVPRLALVLLDMDGGEVVLLHEPLRDEDRVLEVAAFPRHERDEYILAEGEFALLGRGRVRDDLARDDAVADMDDRPLVDAGVLVRAAELVQRVDVLDTRVIARHDAPPVHAGPRAALARHDDLAARGRR